MSLLIVGSMALDSVKTPFGSVENALGGSASFCSMAASYFTEVNMVATIGADFPAEHLELFQKKGIDTSGIKKLPGKTFHWEGAYEYDLNQAHTIKTELNVLTEFEAVFPLPQNYLESEYVFLANIDPALQLKVLEQTGKAKLIACDTMNFWIENKKADLEKLLKKVDILTINEAEIREFSGERSIVKAAKKILATNKNGRLKTIIVKRGEYGAVMFAHDSIFAAPAYPLEDIMDPTGAGDSFAGGFMGYLSNTGDLSDRGLRQAIVIGSVMASLNVESFSLERLKNLSFPEIKQRYTELKKLTGFEELGNL